MSRTRILTVATAVAAAIGALAQVPSIINYQGRLSVGGTNVFDGPGQFKFALVSPGTNVNSQATAVATVSGGFLTVITITSGGAGYLETPRVTITDTTGSNAVAQATITGGVVTEIAVVRPGRSYSPSPVVTIEPPPPSFVYGTFWSNDGTGVAGSEPTAAIPLQVNQGLFAVNLGDTSVSNMTVALNPMVFTNTDIRLRIWFNDGVAGFQQFYPDRRLTSTPYAMMAANISDGAVSTSKLMAAAVNSTELAEDAVTTAKLANGAVTSEKLAPGILTWIPSRIAAFTNSGTWHKPDGVTRVYVKLWGAGGGGGGTSWGDYGGGGGGYCECMLSVAGSVNVVVGNGGSTDTNGGDSSFLSCTAHGGNRGSTGSGGAGGTATGPDGALTLTGEAGQRDMGGDAPLGGAGGGEDNDFGNGGNGSFPGGGGASKNDGAAGLVIVYY